VCAIERPHGPKGARLPALPSRPPESERTGTALLGATIRRIAYVAVAEVGDWETGIVAG
jgi:hypothetical protein